MTLKIIFTLVVALVTGIIALHYMSFSKWLEYACTEAESALGSKTGQLKLKYVYDLAISKFPIIAKIMPFSLFSKMVDNALKGMKEMLSKNDAIAAVVEEQTLIK